MTPEELERAQWLLGPWLAGGFLDVLLQGVLFCQFARYATRHHYDQWGLKVVVIILALMTCLKSIQTFALVWIQSIEYFTDLEGAIALSYTAWWQTGNPLMVATMGIYVQAFLCRRLFHISNRNWFVVLPVACILAFAYAAMCVATYYITVGVEATPLMAPWFAAHFSAVFAGDMCMSATMTYFLLKNKKEVLPQTVGLLTSLIWLTWLSAAPAAVFAMFNLVFSQVWTGDDRLLSSAFNMALPKLYAISMMWTLNSRHDLRVANEMSANSRLAGIHHLQNLKGGRRASTTEQTTGQGLAFSESIDQINTAEVKDMFHHEHDGKNHHKSLFTTQSTDVEVGKEI